MRLIASILLVLLVACHGGKDETPPLDSNYEILTKLYNGHDFKVKFAYIPKADSVTVRKLPARRVDGTDTTYTVYFQYFKANVELYEMKDGVAVPVSKVYPRVFILGEEGEDGTRRSFNETFLFLYDHRN